MLCMFRNWILGCSQQGQSCYKDPVPYSDIYLVFLHFSSPGSGALGLDYSLHPQILKNDDFCLSVSCKGHDLLMNSLMSNASLKDENLKTCRASGIQTKLCDAFPMPEFLFKRLHTENVHWRRLAQGSLHYLKFAVSFLVAWKMVQAPSSVSHSSLLHPEGHIHEIGKHMLKACEANFWRRFHRGCGSSM